VHRKIDSAAAERRRLLDQFQAGMIDMTELHRRSRDVTSRHHELTTKRAALATQRAELARGNLMRRRVTDFADRICTVIDKLDRPQQQLMRLLIEDVRLSGSNVQIRLRISLDPLDPGPTGARPTHKPPAPGLAKTVCVPSVVTDGQSYRLAQATAGKGVTPLPS
jgi:hypothetical protein